MRAVYESDTAERLMPGRLVAGLGTLNPGRGVRIAPRQPFIASDEWLGSASSKALAIRGSRFAGQTE